MFHYLNHSLSHYKALQTCTYILQIDNSMTGVNSFQDIGTTVADTQLAPFTLLVVLDCEANSTKCFAKGKFYMAPDMAILFEADQTTVYATAEGDNFDVFCGWSDKLTWGEDIWYIRVYGLDNDKNNNDHHFMGEVFIRLCDIKFMGKIIYKYM